jgi:phage terminase large subunit-like protein
VAGRRKKVEPTPADPVTAYARDVAAGKVVAGKLVRLAAERHLRDLKDGHRRGLRFDAAEAESAVEFWELCPHLRGTKAQAGELLRLEPWQVFVVGSIYGWKRADGTRRFRVAWCEMGRKNGKTTLAYPAILYALTVDGEEGGEAYSTATKKDQAKLVFDLARRAVTRTPDLAAIITPYKHALTVEDTFSTAQALGADADTLDGLNPSLALADEIHKWRGRLLWDVIETGMGARRQPLLWAITTAGDEGAENVYGQEHDYSRQVLEGVVEDDARFAFIACLDPEDDWTDPKTWAKANPNLGVSVEAEEIGRAVAKATHSPSAANSVKRLRLGIRSQDADAWIPLQTWDAAADPRLTWESLKGFPCFGGLDLASTSDFAALALCFPLAADLTPAADITRPDLWGLLFRLWMPAEGRTWSENKLRELVRPWVDQGKVVSTEGDAIDADAIEAGVIAAAGHFDLMGLAFDPFNASQMAQHLTAAGIDATQFPQRLSSFAEPTRQTDEDLTTGKIRHDGNPCVRWMANNCVLVQNAAGHRMPSRKKSRNKIDGIVAAVMARGRAMLPAAPKLAYYETNPVEVV